MRRKTSHLAHLPCRQLLVLAGNSKPWEVDGELMGLTRQLRVTIQPGNLLVRVPPATTA
jgi:diacylglycerol kinase family enzyme